MSVLGLAGAFLGRHWYLLPIAALFAALIVTRGTLAEAKRDRDAAQAFNRTIHAATREAARNPRLAIKDVPLQITLLGSAVVKLKDGLGRCNSTARAAADRDAENQRTAATRLKQLEARDRGRIALIDELKRSAARPRKPGTCEASEVVKGAWR